MLSSANKIDKLFRSYALMVGIASTIAVFGGCETADEEADGTSDGLSIVEIDEVAGKLVIEYQKSSRSIQYEMRLGSEMEAPPSAEELAANPDLPTYDVDVRVLDAVGNPFLLQMAGHAFLDPRWETSRVEDFDEPGRQDDFEMLGDAVADFRALDLPESLEQLRRTGIQIGLATDDEPAKPEATDSGPSYRSVIKVGPSSVRKWDFVIRKKCFPSCPIGNHSAVVLRGWSAANSVVYRAYSCNHGTCASNTSVMGVHCVMPGFRNDDGTHSRYFYQEGCTTRYNVTSVGGHNCNDDSELQGRAITHDSPQSTTGGSCNSLGPHNWAPGCTY